MNRPAETGSRRGLGGSEPGAGPAEAAPVHSLLGLRGYDWTGFAALGGVLFAILELLWGHPDRAAWSFGGALLAGMVSRWWSVKYPAPMPHLLRWTLLVPRGAHSPAHLKRILEPRSGERILEIGPGIGVHSIPVAAALAPAGRLDVFDVQQAMLDDVARKATKAGLVNIVATLGNAEKLPYADRTFDAAYLIGVLGEIGDGERALGELQRVLKANGRLVVGEVAFDVDFIRLGALVDRARAAGFLFESKVGGSLSFLARFRAVPRA